MSSQNADGLIRFGLLSLPLAGLLSLAGLYGALRLGTGGILATGDNRAIASGGYLASVFIGNVLALTVLLFGVVALFAYLGNGGERVLATAAMVLSIVGIGLLVSGLGVYAYSVPALSRSFLDGHAQSITILDAIFAGPYMTVMMLAFLSYSVGFVLFGVVIWDSGALPRWAGVLLAAHAPLISGPFHFSVVVSLLGSLMAVAGGGWIALSVLRLPPARREPEAEPRVGRDYLLTGPRRRGRRRPARGSPEQE
jgi:hypothetical protein